jgi:hypothetical protein
VTLDPPLPIYLLNLVAGLREKNAKGYPVKKVRHTLLITFPKLYRSPIRNDNSSCYLRGNLSSLLWEA